MNAWLADLLRPGAAARRRSPRVLAGLAWLAAVTASVAAAGGAPGVAPEVESTVVPGLAAPAQIVIDRWGVPHLYAASTDDLFFVQGFNAARDRLFQIDLWRRRGLGRLAAALGPDFVEQDRAARLFLYRGDMAREWRRYGPGAERIATRFVAGINAYIDLVGREPARLPLEFARLGYAPEKWQAEDVVRIRSHGLARNLGSEVWRALVACRSSVQADEVRQPLSPHWQAQLPAGLDPCVPPQLMRAYLLGTQAVSLPLHRRVGVADPVAAFLAAAAPAGSAGTLEGSNAWVVGPARSGTGRPLLANDPHRGYAAPSLRYLVHLSAPGLDVIGGGEPALPGVSIGHNDRIAFGLTVFSADQEDLYVEALNPERPDEVRHGGGWERLRTVREAIPVRGGPPVTVELQFTRHGPVLYVDRARQRAYALRSVWFEPGTAPYVGSLGVMQARDFEAFKRAMSTWGTPSENQLYADVAGNIGWVAGGLMPVRPNWDGLLPVPGDGRYEWAGFWGGDQLPSAYNPAAGWLASANEMNLPAGYPVRERKLGFEWPPDTRWQRIAEHLRARPKLSVEDSMQLQNDLLSLPARRLQAVLRSAALSDPKAVSAARLLQGWDAVERGDSPAAALFELWWSRHLGTAVKDALAPRNAAALIRTADTGLLLQTLEQPGAAFGPGATARRDRLLDATLAAAWAELERLAGPDPAAWRWDRLHSVRFEHPLANAFDAATRARLEVGPFPKQGGGDTVNVSAYDPATLRQIGGPSLRLVMDVGDWDNSRAVNTPGQSGDPASPHYRDLASMWLQGAYFPLLYSRAKVEAAAERRIELLPPNPIKPPKPSAR